MTHDNRGRLTVDLGGKWRLYTNSIPHGAEARGVVTRGDTGESGALVKLSGGSYVQINAGCMRNLDGRKVAAAIGNAGRPAQMDGGRRVQVYLDAESIDRAEQIGGGNVSAGIREALKIVTETRA